VAHVLLFLRRGKADKRLLMTLIALAGVFTAWTLPLVLEKESLSIAVAILAFMFLWLGGRLHSGFLQSLGHLLYMIVLWRFFVFDLRGGYGRLPAPSAGDMSMYWKDMAGRMWTFGMIIGSAVLAFLLERRQARLEAAEPERAVSDQYTARAVSPGIGAGIFFWCSIAVAFVVLHKELALMFSYWRPFHAPALTCLWAAMGCMFLWNYATGRWNERAMFGLLMIFFFASAFKVLFVDMDVWRLSGGWIYTAEYGWRHLTARCLDFAMVTGVGAAAFVLAGLRRGSPATAALFGYASLAMIFLYATFETKTFLSLKLPAFLGGGVSALWALFAIAFVGSGIWKSVRGLRYLGLALFAVVLGKVFLADLAHMPLVHRVVAFMVVGAALLLGSFAYLYAGRKFTGQTPSNGETGEA
jgi:uncharacterized membrane protein